MGDEFLEAALLDILVARGLTQEQAETASITVLQSIHDVIDDYLETFTAN